MSDDNEKKSENSDATETLSFNLNIQNIQISSAVNEIIVEESKKSDSHDYAKESNKMGREKEKPRRLTMRESIEQKIPQKYKIGIANAICIIGIVLVWVSFLVPCIVIAYSTYNTYLTENNFKVNDTLPQIFRADLCPGNKTLDYALSAIEKVRLGNFSNFSCPPDMLTNGTQCVRRCRIWHAGGQTYAELVKITVPILSGMTMVVSIIGASTWLCAKKLWKFPQIISFYLIICVIGQSSLIFVSNLAPIKFFCSSESLGTTFDDSTIQCQIQGPFYHYFLLAFMIWYVFDVCNILFVLLFPLKSYYFISNLKRIHIVESIICWGTPAIIVALVLIITRKYSILSEFPIVCLTDTITSIFTLFLPGIIFSVSTWTAFLLLGTTLYKRHVKVVHMSSNSEYLAIIKQIVVFSVAFAIVSWFVVLFYTAAGYTAREDDVFRDAYLKCITVFWPNNSCCDRKPFELYQFAYLNVLSDYAFCSWGFFGVSAVLVKEAKSTWINLILKCKCCKELIKRIKPKAKHIDNATLVSRYHDTNVFK